MAATLVGIEMEVVPDSDPDGSYLEQEGLGFEDRLEAYRNGEFGFVGVRAVATIRIPHGDAEIIEHISSPGLWGIEDDSPDAYLKDVFEDEKEVLFSILNELNVSRVEF